jgi:hypothetical protein
VELLRRWKAEAEEEAKRRLARPQHRLAPSAAVTRFSRHTKSIIAALNHYNDKSLMLGIEGHVTQMALAAEMLGIPAPIEIETLPYPDGAVPTNPLLKDRFEGRCVIRFPDGSEESGRAAHAKSVQLLVEARDSAIVALEQWLIYLDYDVDSTEKEV